MLLVMDAELEVVWGMQPLDRDVFMYLCQRCDLQTGVIGKSWRVSYGGMALDLSEREVARRKVGDLRKVSSKQVENAVNRLVAAGLLKRLSESGKACDLVLARVFFVDALGLGNSVQNPDGRQLGGFLVGLNGILNNKNNELGDIQKLSWDGKSSSVGTTLYINQSINQGAKMKNDQRFAMTLDWQYSEADLGMMLKRAGYDLSQVEKVWVLEFVTFWWSDGRQFNEREWLKKLCGNLLDYLRDPGLYDRRRGVASVAKPVGGADKGKPAVRYGWEFVPRDDGKLDAYARQWGFPSAAPGQDFQQYRARLEREVSKRLGEVKRGLS